MMTTLKKGNVLKHAKASKKTVTFVVAKAKKKTVAKKSLVKKSGPKKTVPAKKPVRVKNQYKYSLQMQKTGGMWRTVLGMNNLEEIKQCARMYAKNFPTIAFRVMD